jgi:hypothetical protein
MPAPDSTPLRNDGIRPPAILVIAAMQLIVLLALSQLVAFYLTWSSDAAVAEFMATAKPASSAQSYSPQQSSPATAEHRRKICAKRAT